jgi:acetyl-CoA C-acetyltransferase
VLLSGRRAKEIGAKPIARVLAYATGGGPPEEVFYAPVVAVKRLLAKGGWTIGAFDLIEANEAFAVQALADGKELGWDWSRVNVHGGAVALGHPIGASGARVLTTLVHALQARGGGRGAASLCIGGGMGTAMIVEAD